MGVFADRQAARDEVDFAAISAARDEEVEAYALEKSQDQKKSADESHEAAVVHQAEAASISAESGYTGGSPGEQNFERPGWMPEVTVLQEVVVPPTVVPVVYEQALYDIGPPEGGPDVPMSLPKKPPPLGALMVFLDRQLLMTMPFNVGEGPLEMKRLFQIPRHSMAYVRVHTGRGTLLPGESIHLREYTPQPAGGVGGSYGSGEPDWSEIPRDLNDALGTLMKEKFFWWFFGDPLGLYGEDE